MDWFAHLFDFVLKLDCSNQTTFNYSVPSAVADGHESRGVTLVESWAQDAGISALVLAIRYRGRY